MDDTKRRERLERLFLEHAGAVRAYARRRADPAVADDVLSEVFVVAWRRLDDVPENALPWLLGCARNMLAHHWRRSRRDRALLDRIGGPVSSAAWAAAIEYWLARWHGSTRVTGRCCCWSPGRG